MVSDEVEWPCESSHKRGLCLRYKSNVVILHEPIDFVAGQHGLAQIYQRSGFAEAWRNWSTIFPALNAVARSRLSRR